ncbi:unnamed protein product [Brassicogethes aeneus]|uniref:Proteasome inhibitor PI31 subunit n=1 Tax=Brassicogethes aeneus TaxID=1431903 RepID=A0A9P0BA80_BRAAE|nr:unnamed protein product [Brassicogethes aeneus]
MAGLFGWDLLYNSVKEDVKNHQDVLVCLTHLVLVTNGFKCVGVGESKNIDGSETKTESLPKGWNDEYTLRYVHSGRLYNLKGTMLDDGIIINLFRVDERTVSLIQLNTESVASRHGSIEDIIPDYGTVVEQIKKQLIESIVVSSKSRDSSSQTEQPTTSERPSRSSIPDPYPRHSGNPLQIGGVMDPGYGRADLDPFNGMDPLRGPANRIYPGRGGGMLYQPPPMPGPFNPHAGLPPGAVPPGARFDPFRPPDTRQPPRGPRRPDSDEMPPPGYDDMFM